VAAGERTQQKTNYADLPDKTGRYGLFGGRYVPETLIPALDELELEYKKASADPAFKVRVVNHSCH
jgi:tryptophan synthase beta chain